ncbi:MAG: hypothetical protein CSA81_09905 [Acidobacteria bacterium]|nr:MAG: hypothetical protein CSA81_09905 [Acidobacteriota bacterium]
MRKQELKVRAIKMNKEEANKNRAIEAFLEHEHAGLPGSKLNLVFARSGVGKSSFAVNFGLDYALKSQQVLHFSVGMTSEKIHEYYHEIFLDMAKANKLSANDWRTVEHHFTVITYIKPDNLFKKMETEIKTLIEDAGMSPKLIIVDGVDFSERSKSKLKLFEEIAEHQNIPILMTLRIHRKEDGALAIEEPLHLAQEFTDSIYLMDFEDRKIVIKRYAQSSDTPYDLPFYVEPHTMLLKKSP